ncbi:MAG: hypothetical protein JHD35_22245 [Sphingopyxis sp.]|uniref:hypothetical protein n=1 Tax=Sphingobium sp. TaxID=1912891 RepID=UPI001A187FC0|nr:hypothetical protein [Sphingobium sp.]MBJ7441720.1 hypothetical protein [Sphingopyxis sp.]
MTVSALIVRETCISIVINGAISVGIGLLLFGLDRPVPSAALAWDFLPQSFMIALMGTLVPALLLRKRLGVGVGDILRRAVAMAVAAALLPGALAALLTRISLNGSMDAGDVLLLKAVYGATLAAVVTPIMLIALVRQSGNQT